MSRTNISDESIVLLIIDLLSPTESLYDSATSKYESVSKWLVTDEGLLGKANPKLYAQGSFAIGTPNRPTKQNEFDFDFVCEADLHPFELLILIKERLEQNELYKGKVELKNRCVRLYYKNDFYLDILPAQPDYKSSLGCVLIPDRKLKALISTNPKGYAHWFARACRHQVFNERLAKSFVEPAPQFLRAEQKFVLQRVTQLTKRHRDIFFKSNSDMAPVSIILTTLAGTHFYNRSNTLEALAQIWGDIQRITMASPEPIKVENPSNPGEILTEKWLENPERYKAFQDWVSSFASDLNLLNTTQGIHNKARLLRQMFGEDLVEKALNIRLNEVTNARSENDLKIHSSGILAINAATSTARVPTNTFFGSEEEE